MSILLKKELVFSDVSAASWEEVLSFLGEKMVESGVAKDTFVDAIINRENEFPTGLPMAAIGIAIPHANPDNVNEDAFAIAKLREPVKFRNMGDPDEEVGVNIVIMMCLTEKQVPIEVLSSILEMFSEDGLAERIRQVKMAEDLFEIFFTRITKI